MPSAATSAFWFMSDSDGEQSSDHDVVGVEAGEPVAQERSRFWRPARYSSAAARVSFETDEVEVRAHFDRRSVGERP